MRIATFIFGNLERASIVADYVRTGITAWGNPVTHCNAHSHGMNVFGAGDFKVVHSGVKPLSQTT